MNTPITSITDKEYAEIENFIETHPDDEIDGLDMTRRAPLSYILRFWDKEKEFLYKAFSNKLMVSKNVEIAKSADEICRDLDIELYRDGSPCEEFLRAYEKWVAEHYNVFYDCLEDEGKINEDFICDRWDYHWALRTIASSYRLARGTWDLEPFPIPMPDGTTLQINKGCKIMRMLKKIADAYELPGYEEFRITHSMALNQKKLHGNLVLSIHPLDYMTMSMNNSGWQSCMRWGCGEYHQGTIEMMNSPYVVVAYLTASTPYYPNNNDFEWSNKKWRQLLIVDDNFICGVKSYPYHNENLTAEAIKLMRELLHQNTDCRYQEEVSTITAKYEDSPEFDISDSQTGKIFNIEFETDKMYNDMSHVEDIQICMGEQAFDFDVEFISYTMCYSGRSECMWCGDDSYNINCDQSFCYKCGI